MPPEPVEHLQLLAGPTTSPKNQVLSSLLPPTSFSLWPVPFPLFFPHIQTFAISVQHKW